MMPIYNQNKKQLCDYYLCSYPIGECAGICNNCAPKTNKEKNAASDSKHTKDN
jgi:hypothetical protein